MVRHHLIYSMCVIVCTTMMLSSLNRAFAQQEDYEIYSESIDHVVKDYKKKFGSDYSLKYYILEIFKDIHIHKDIQERHSKYIKKFSIELSKKFANNNELEHTVSDSFKLNIDYDFLPDSISKEYFHPKAKDAWGEFYKDFPKGAVIGLPKIIYNKKRDKAALLLYIYKGYSPGGMLNLLMLEKRKGLWKVKKVRFIAWMN